MVMGGATRSDDAVEGGVVVRSTFVPLFDPGKLGQETRHDHVHFRPRTSVFKCDFLVTVPRQC